MSGSSQRGEHGPGTARTFDGGAAGSPNDGGRSTPERPLISKSSLGRGWAGIAQYVMVVDGWVGGASGVLVEDRAWAWLAQAFPAVDDWRARSRWRDRGSTEGESSALAKSNSVDI